MGRVTVGERAVFARRRGQPQVISWSGNEVTGGVVEDSTEARVDASSRQGPN